MYILTLQEARDIYVSKGNYKLVIFINKLIERFGVTAKLTTMENLDV